MEKTRVVHCKKEEFDVYIGRPSIFGNPFTINGIRGRDGAIRDFADWLKGKRFVGYRAEQRAKIIKALPSLRGKVLACWCSPKKCHGDVLARLADKK